jgi:hypothetical protein
MQLVDRDRILRALGPDVSGVRLIGGFTNLAAFLAEAFIDSCI